MSGPIPGYPTPVHDPNAHEVRADPDEENPNELVLEAAEVNPALPPLLPRRQHRQHDAAGPDPDPDRAP